MAYAFPDKEIYAGKLQNKESFVVLAVLSLSILGRVERNMEDGEGEVKGFEY